MTEVPAARRTSHQVCSTTNLAHNDSSIQMRSAAASWLQKI